MLDLRLGPGLALKPVLLIGIIRADELDCKVAAEAGVDRAVDEPHGALAEKVDDGVAIPVRYRVFEDARQRLAGSSRGGLFSGSSLVGPAPVRIVVPNGHVTLSLTRNDYEL